MAVPGPKTRRGKKRKRPSAEEVYVKPLREGHHFDLLDLTYRRDHDPRSGELISRAHVKLRIRGMRRVYHGDGRAAAGTVTAIELALRDAISFLTGELPTTELLAYHLRIASGRLMPDGPVEAHATVRIDGHQWEIRVQNPDGATAGGLLLFEAYDRLFYEQWCERLRIAGLTPEEARSAMFQEAPASRAPRMTSDSA